MIVPDYENGKLLIKRGDKTIHSFTFKDFVSAEQFKPVNKLRNELVAIAQGKKEVSQTELEKQEKKFYDQATTIGLENPMPMNEALKLMTTAEMGQLSEEILIFLVNWSSIEEVKQYALQLAETQKNDTKA